jgi:hypothetical protein
MKQPHQHTKPYLKECVINHVQRKPILRDEQEWPPYHRYDLIILALHHQYRSSKTKPQKIPLRKVSSSIYNTKVSIVKLFASFSFGFHSIQGFEELSSIIVFQFKIHHLQELQNLEVQFKVWGFGFRGSFSVEQEA